MVDTMNNFGVFIKEKERMYQEKFLWQLGSNLLKALILNNGWKII